MSIDTLKVGIGSQDVKRQATYFHQHLQTFLLPLCQRLDQLLDRRLVRTFEALLSCVVRFRHNSLGLLLSELGGKLLGGQHAPAGTKRISNLLRSKAWSHELIGEFLLEKAQALAQHLQDQQQIGVLLWDDSVIEKAESLRSEGLCAVRSSKARRLKRIKPGFYNPPGGRPICVPGFEWMGLLLAGLKTHPSVAFFKWYTTRGPHAQNRISLQNKLLQQAIKAFGTSLWHVFDRGYAGKRWLGELFTQQVGFVLRWPKRYELVDAKGRRSCWQIARGKPTQVRRKLWDAHQHCWREAKALALSVSHPDFPQHPLWLVVSRIGRGREPWYLLTNQPCEKADQVWSVVLAYGRRWQIEACWRYSKSELAIQSPRLWWWENRLKLMMMVAVVYAFLLQLLNPEQDQYRLAILRAWCHRTGKRYQQTLTPLYRLRAALAELLTTYQIILQNSG
ncbi:hypothetical protein GCM10023187_52540 [Nibrella viscosa]|uniref:Transposase IS4-like domain-containing protein n=1 Tax=Nibrella viscosa TaxID=1084524 RepID=A0ABP8KXL4_9BACT